MLPKQTQTFFISLLLGALLAIARRRTVTQRFRAAQISDDYRQAFYHIPNIGCKGVEIFDVMTWVARVVFAETEVAGIVARG